MASSSTEGLVPINRAFLSRYYDKYPFDPLSEDVAHLTAHLRSSSDALLKEFPGTTGEEILVHEVDLSPPQKIDENMWKNREHMEEILFLLDRSHWPSALKQQSRPEDNVTAAAVGELESKLRHTLKALEQFQSHHADRIFNTVMTYMPQDFRGTLIRLQRERSERNKQVEVDALVSSGGSIHDRYALLWHQQMERRRQLAELGASAGVYKTLVKYLVGVPEVLLDFIRQINDDHGQKDELALLKQAVDVYSSEFQRFLKFISEVFANAPFFISAAEAGAGESGKKDDYKETVVPAGKTHEVSLYVESVNSYIGWDFSLTQGKMNVDIGFSVEYISPSGETMMILPYRRSEADQGNFSTLMAGCYKLIWDNSYSTFFKKTLRYKVDCIPPVAEADR